MLTLSLPINIAFAANDSGYDFSEWTDEQITDLFAQVKVEMNKRGLAQAKELSPKDMTQSDMTLKKGMYVVGSVGNSYIELTSWKLQNDHDGKPAIVLTYTWTNNSNETAKASLAVSIEAYQNGVSLDNAFFIDGVDTSSGIKNVRPGYSIEVQTAFRLSDTTADVELEFKDMWDIFGSSTPINTTIHLS